MVTRYRMLSAALLTAATLAFTLTNGTAAGAATPASHHDPDANVRINQIQTVGTHNSYHVENTEQEKDVRDAIRPNTGHGGEQYTHIPVQQQLSLQKVRQVELDLVRDPDGGRFANPLLRRLTGAGPWFPSVMNQPGIKVLHEEDVDYRTNCLTFVACLSQIRSWTQRHHGAIPITILLQFDDGAGPTFPPYTTQPLLPWTKDAMIEAENEALSVFPREQIITPDDVRKPGLTLHQSVLQDNWPTLAKARGKVLFGMDNDRDAYVADNPNLEGRLFFTNTQNALDADDAAFVIRDNPTTLKDQIQSLVKEGMLVRSRADTPQVQAQSGDTTRRDDAFASGAQFVSTDYPVPGMAQRWGTDYFAALPGPLVAQCNPLNAPASCQSGALDRADSVLSNR